MQNSGSPIPGQSPGVFEDVITYRVNALTGEALYCFPFLVIGKLKAKVKVYRSGAGWHMSP